MGGFGSGRHEYARTPTVEECRHLEANDFTDVVDQPGRSLVLRWGEEDTGSTIRAVMLPERSPEDHPAVDGPPHDDADSQNTLMTEPERAEAIRLSYTMTPPGGEARELSYRVPLEYTEPNFGGVRPWFRCPKCGDRVGKLYLPPRGGRFLCRECHDLGYQSSRSSGNELERAEQRYRKAFAKADAENRRPHPNNAPYFPERPKGMHHDTFEDLADDVEAARREWHQEMDSRVRELVDHSQDVIRE
jgi:hypothetical protein